MAMEAFMVVGRVAVVLALTLGWPIIWLMLLNLRDRRQDRVLQTVLGEVSSRELMGQVAVRVRSGLISRRSVVMVHILAYSPNEIWEIMTRLSRRLSPEVRLELTGTVGRDFLTTFTVKPVSGRPLPRPRQASLAAS